MSFEDIISLITGQLGDVIISEDENATPKAVEISAKELVNTMNFLFENDQLYFDMLSCITGLDNGPEDGSMEVIYNLYSIPFDHHLMVKVKLDRNAPKIDTVSHIWQTGDWLEREVFDMYGIEFTNHPDLRRILLPNDWIGHPLKKDYKEQDTYHGITVLHEDSLNKEKES
ncbi:NADH-quinone oxidoreductase subunit C [Fulvivirga lutea]|uniref:NADH-quinone oxidoreductase subunit C n=1 Tax=Fulvivirga lutea TaxID=2810512 RepID=A0A975A249_9BACT|nr:NADH-quinone oxidoreductase subunit C [Fulvivirga lutea]QSE98920.1 NADH-quinone oxidoreductase subunit C [Fulvivirga lutea]